ncbi:MAG: hypothetical protein J2P25_00895 [Nocardiopsaceae bacterium]|nr:hypothetical protein [Nocardiopsaceae bacterium]
MRRSRGALTGFLLLILGAWGGLIAFVGPYFHYAYTPATTWTYTTDRLWLEILPGAAVFLGGLLVMMTAARHVAMFGALLAAAAGAWFALGTLLSPLWNHNVPLGGVPTGATVTARIAEQVGFFSGLGIVVVFLAAIALGRLLTLPPEATPEPAEPYSADTAPTTVQPTIG